MNRCLWVGGTERGHAQVQDKPGIGRRHSERPFVEGWLSLQGSLVLVFSKEKPLKKKRRAFELQGFVVLARYEMDSAAGFKRMV